VCMWGWGCVGGTVNGVWGSGGGARSARAAQGLLGQLARAGIREGECWVSQWR
jgi:hypothetical protein